VSLAGILLEWRLAARGVSLFAGDAAARVKAFDETFLILAALCLPAVLAASLMQPSPSRQ
jgi:DHA2 family multidrug resistance protein